MGLNKGDRLGPYEVQSQLGAGGMGEVYKATDTPWIVSQLSFEDRLNAA